MSRSSGVIRASLDDVELQPFGPDDAAALASYVDIANAGRAADTPFLHSVTLASAAHKFRHGWDGEPPAGFLVVDAGEPVGYAEYYTSEWDNQHLAWLWAVVHPGHRRRGIGTWLLAAIEDRARHEGRTSIGFEGWDSDRTRAFAAERGFEEKCRAVMRRQTLADVDWAEVERLHAEAVAAASAYELVRRVGPSPDEELGALGELTAAINDAPTGDLDIEDEVFPAERIRGYETAQTEFGTLHRVLARHRETGDLAGHTVVLVEHERPWIGDQQDTAVAGAHRGHRLGLLLKTEMMLWLREVQPQVATIDTGNAEENSHMIGINEQLGYRVLGVAGDYQKAVGAAP